MQTLIDKAIQTCGSVNELARRLCVSPNVISMMKSRRTITPVTAALLADVAGEDAREAAIQAVIENAKGTRHEGVLREILGKGLVLGVAGLLVFSYNAEPTSELISANDVTKSLTSYTSWNVEQTVFHEAITFCSLFLFGLRIARRLMLTASNQAFSSSVCALQVSREQA